MKKIISVIISLVIVLTFSACSSEGSNSSYSSADISETTTQNTTNQQSETISWLGNEYPVNISLNFDVKDMEYSEMEFSEEEITWITFCSDSADIIDDIENYDFSTGPVQAVAVCYAGLYSEVINGNAEILGAAETVYTGKSSDSFSGWNILYDPDGEVIFKTDVNTLECGLHKNYYDKNDVFIASYSGWDDENETSLWIDSNGNTIDEYELEDLLQSMCPNEYIGGII